MRRLILALALAASPARAGLDVVPTDPTAQINAAVAAEAAARNTAIGTATSGMATSSALSAVQATIPTASPAVPSPDTTTGAAGSGLTFTPANSVRPSRVRTGNCSLTVVGSTASCSGSWDGTGFPSTMNSQTVTPQPLGDPAVLNTAGGPIYKCNWMTVSLSGFSVICTQEKSAVLSLSALTLANITIAPSAAAPATTVVYVTGIAKLTS